MGLRQSLRIAASTLLLACGLQFAHADSSPQTIVFGVAPGPYGEAGDCADIKRKRV